MLIKGLRPQGALGFPRGEAVAQIGSSEPIWVTDEECGKYAFLINQVGTYSNLSAKKKFQPSPKSRRSRPSSSSAPFGGTFPPGEGIASPNSNFTTNQPVGAMHFQIQD